MLTNFLKQEIKEKALSNNNQEICGLLIETNTGVAVFHSRNSALNKTKYFCINPIDYIKASEIGKIVGCYHTHINENIEFSNFDKQNAEKHKLTYILYSVTGDKFLEYNPQNKKSPYLDRIFEFGKNDCFSLVKDFYLKELNINLGEYFRNNVWFQNNPNLIIQNFEKEGFSLIKDKENLQKYDLLCLGKNEKELFHFMVLLEDEIILHHPRNKLSIMEKLTQSRKNHIKAVFRHKILTKV
jgi:proteasome lid subunit RPN8/RPN11